MHSRTYRQAVVVCQSGPEELAERILARLARPKDTWIDKDGRETRLYVPDGEERIMAVDEIFTQREGNLWRRVRFAERPSAH